MYMAKPFKILRERMSLEAQRRSAEKAAELLKQIQAKEQEEKSARITELVQVTSVDYQLPEKSSPAISSKK
jgi:hypothetical protein